MEKGQRRRLVMMTMLLIPEKKKLKVPKSMKACHNPELLVAAKSDPNHRVLQKRKGYSKTSRNIEWSQILVPRQKGPWVYQKECGKKS